MAMGWWSTNSNTPSPMAPLTCCSDPKTSSLASSPSTAGMQEVEQRRSSCRGASTARPSHPISRPVRAQCTWKCRCREAHGCARAANARHRHLIVTRQSARASPAQIDNTTEPSCAPMTWLARLKRVFNIDISVCPNCGGRLRVIGEVTEPKTIARILEHVKAREHHEHTPRAPPVLLAS